MLDVFDVLLDVRVDTDDVSVGEIMRGDYNQTEKLIKAIQTRFASA